MSTAGKGVPEAICHQRGSSPRELDLGAGVPSSSMVRTHTPTSRTARIPSLCGANRCPCSLGLAGPGGGSQVPRSQPGEGGSRTQGLGARPQEEGREPGRLGGGLWVFLAELGRPPEAFPTFQKFLGTGWRGWGQPYIDYRRGAAGGE